MFRKTFADLADKRGRVNRLLNITRHAGGQRFFAISSLGAGGGGARFLTGKVLPIYTVL